MKPEQLMQEDEEELLRPRRRARKNSSKTRAIGKWVLIVLGLLVLFAAGIITGLYGLLRVPMVKARFAESLNATETLQDLEDQPPLVFPAVIGTNDTVNFLIDLPDEGFSLVDTGPSADALAALDFANAQPALARAANPNCQFLFRSHLLRPLADFLSPSNKLEITDVAQGGTGDCGFGASLLALIGNQQQQEILNALELRDLRNLRARFLVPSTDALVPNQSPFNNLKTVRVEIDDFLPQLDPPNTADCGSYAGFFPGNTNGRPTVFVPLLEKAFAKFLDANPNLKINAPGYAGLHGIQAGNVLQSITGGIGKLYERFRFGSDLTMAAAFVKCINLRRACVLGVPPATDPRLGVPVNGRINTPAGVITINKGSKTFTLREAGTDREITMVGLHYYGIERTQFIDGQFVTFENAEVILHNPWSCNVSPTSQLTCVPGISRSFRVKLSSLQFIATGVEWSEPMDI